MGLDVKTVACTVHIVLLKNRPLESWQGMLRLASVSVGWLSSCLVKISNPCLFLVSIFSPSLPAQTCKLLQVMVNHRDESLWEMYSKACTSSHDAQLVLRSQLRLAVSKTKEGNFDYSC